MTAADIALRFTDDPDVVLAQSRSDPTVWHRIEHANTLTPRCSCPALRPDCTHILALFDRRITRKDYEGMGETNALVPVRMNRSQLVTMAARERREQLQLGRAGYEDALFLAKQAIEMGMTPTVREKQGDRFVDVPMKPEHAAAVILCGADLGFTWTQCWAVIAPIEGRPYLMAKGIQATIEKSGKGHLYVRETSPQRATVVAVRDGRPDLVISITMEQAAKQGWTTRTFGRGQERQTVQKDNWKNDPAGMLRRRAITAAGWGMFPDVLLGMDVIDTEAEVIEGEYEVITQASIDAMPSSSYQYVTSEGEVVPAHTPPVSEPASAGPAPAEGAVLDPAAPSTPDDGWDDADDVEPLPPSGDDALWEQFNAERDEVKLYNSEVSAWAKQRKLPGGSTREQVLGYMHANALGPRPMASFIADEMRAAKAG